MSERPTLLMLIGAPGSGKSSWVRRHPDEVTRRHYDVDAMAQALGNFNDAGCRDRARKQLDAIIAGHLSDRETFSYETTFGISQLRRVDEAKNKGFRIEAIYFCIDDVDTNLERIDVRVQRGSGHWVDPDQVARRRLNAHKNFVDTAHRFDAVELIDNTEDYYRSVARLEGRKVIETTDNLPAWAKTLLRDIQSRDPDQGG